MTASLDYSRMHARIMLVTTKMNKKACMEIVTERFPRLPESPIKIGELFMYILPYRR